MESLVSVVLVNYNGMADTEECVKSLIQCDYSNLHIIIVDNDSKTDRAEYNDIINKDVCEIIYMENNIGFAGANNVGIKRAEEIGSEYVLILNNDTIVEKDFLIPLINVCEDDKNIGIVTGKIYYYDERDYLWFGGGYYDNKLCECKIDGIGQKDNLKFSQKKMIPYATACLWLIPMNVLKAVGYMSEDYFLYYEDADYCERVKAKGYKIWYVPESKIYHKESRSTKKGSNSYKYYNIRNYLMFIRKYCNYKNKPRVYFNKFYVTFKDVIRHRTEYKVWSKAWMDFLTGKKGKMDI
jgi:predicted glycosyltransferase